MEVVAMSETEKLPPACKQCNRPLESDYEKKTELCRICLNLPPPDSKGDEGAA